jgi:hypothetical protein
MTPEESKTLERMPDEFSVYRGFQNGAREGYSWTLRRDVAEEFATENKQFPPGEVIERRVRKSEVYAFLQFDEEEIILRKDSAFRSAKRP